MSWNNLDVWGNWVWRRQVVSILRSPRVADATKPLKMQQTMRFQFATLKEGRGTMIDEQEFKKRADHAMHDVSTTLSQAAETDDYEVDFNNGNVVIEFENPPAKFVVSPQTATRQIWVSAHSK